MSFVSRFLSASSSRIGVFLCLNSIKTLKLCMFLRTPQTGDDDEAEEFYDALESN